MVATTLSDDEEDVEGPEEEEEFSKNFVAFALQSFTETNAGTVDYESTDDLDLR